MTNLQNKRSPPTTNHQAKWASSTVPPTHTKAPALSRSLSLLVLQSYYWRMNDLALFACWNGMVHKPYSTVHQGQAGLVIRHHHDDIFLFRNSSIPYFLDGGAVCAETFAKAYLVHILLPNALVVCSLAASKIELNSIYLQNGILFCWSLYHTS